MLYLVRYKDGFLIGADGSAPHGAHAKAEAATGRPFADVDAITERDTTAVVYDSTRGWLAARMEPRDDAHVVDVNTGDVVGAVKPEPKPEGLELDPPANADLERERALAAELGIADPPPANPDE